MMLFHYAGGLVYLADLSLVCLRVAVDTLSGSRVDGISTTHIPQVTSPCPFVHSSLTPAESYSDHLMLVSGAPQM
jgi:hypothetical protein